MKRYALLAAGVMILAALVPAGQAAEPNGKGLFREHVSHCTGAGIDYTGKVTLVPGGGASFWVDGHHLVIQSAVITPEGGDPITYTLGNKTGKAGDLVTCVGDFPAEGTFPAYHVVSYDVVVP